MKSLFYTLLIFGGAFLAYDYFLAPPGQKIVFKSLNPPQQQSAPVKHIEPPKPVVTGAAPEPVKPIAQEAPMPAAPAPAAPAPVAASKETKFDSIETLTGNWLKIPPTAFPREVRLLQDALFKMNVGASKVAAGGVAFAISAENGVLILAPTATSPARAQLPIDGTDLKARLNETYEKRKVLRAEELKAAALRKSQSQSSAPAVAAAPPSGEVEAGGKPVRSGNGSYPLLLASMQRGQVTEVTPDNVTGWQEAQPTTVQGKNGWVVKVNFNARTVFGPQPAEAQAIVLDGRVAGWYFTGSGEEIP